MGGKRQPRCQHSIYQELHALVCRRLRGHDGTHVWWSPNARVEWGEGGTVFLSESRPMWRQGVRYPRS